MMADQIERSIDQLEPALKRRVAIFLDRVQSNEQEKIVSLLRGAEVRSFADLYERLKDEQSELRSSLCYLLAFVGDRRSTVPHLAQVLRDSSDASLRSDAASALGMLGGVRARRALEQAVLNDADSDVRFHAATSLGILGDAAAVPSLMTTLRSSTEHLEVRSVAAEALGYIGDARAVPDLVELLDHPEVSLRFWATFALGHFPDRRLIDRLDRLAREDNGVLPGVGSIRGEAQKATAQIEAILSEA